MNGKRTVDSSFHRELGLIIWDHCGMARERGWLEKPRWSRSRSLREEFWSDVKVPGEPTRFNQELERAGRVADFLEFAEVMCRDALTREESCGGHFREEHQTEEGEAAARRRRLSRMSRPGSTRARGRRERASQGTSRIRERQAGHQRSYK